MSKKTLAGGGLLAISAFMLLGFMNSSLSLGSPSALAALFFVVVLPLAGGSYLIFQDSQSNKALGSSKNNVANLTLEAEILKMAGQHQGKLTALEVATEFAIPTERAEAALDAMALKKLADYEVTDSGLLVYHFTEMAQLKDKNQSRGLLDD